MLETNFTKGSHHILVQRFDADVDVDVEVDVDVDANVEVFHLVRALDAWVYCAFDVRI